MDSEKEKIQKAYEDTVLNEGANKVDKKKSMYRDGCYGLRHSFSDFSQGYMRAMGLMTQSKKAVDPKYKKHRDAIATAYERMDAAISKHLEDMEKDDMERAKKDRPM